MNWTVSAILSCKIEKFTRIWGTREHIVSPQPLPLITVIPRTEELLHFISYEEEIGCRAKTITIKIIKQSMLIRYFLLWQCFIL